MNECKNTPLLEIRNLKVKADGNMILNGVDLTIFPGEIHVVMGRNGSGKSTLSNVIAGKEDYEIVEGDILYKGRSILDLSPDARAAEGIFMAFQYPVELPGVNERYFLRTAYNAIRKARGLEPISVTEFNEKLKSAAKLLNLDEELLSRSVNEGFSGGEKKRNEILQMAILEPELCILDETDSGLDIDALKTVANAVNLLASDKNRAFLIITHYNRLLHYIKPDRIHIMADGKIVKSGDESLAEQLEASGYDAVLGA